MSFLASKSLLRRVMLDFHEGKQFVFYEDIKKSSKSSKCWHKEVLFSFSCSEAFIIEEGLRPHTVFLPRHMVGICHLT